MNVQLLTEHHLKFGSLKGGCTGSSESALVKMPHCWKSHVVAHICSYLFVHLHIQTIGHLIVLKKHEFINLTSLSFHKKTFNSHMTKRLPYSNMVAILFSIANSLGKCGRGQHQ